MKRNLKRLLQITEGCREDMHEPGEQNLDASVIGTHFDNCFGESIFPTGPGDFPQEIVVILRKEDRTEDGVRMIKESFNLATLIALARKAKLE